MSDVANIFIKMRRTKDRKSHHIDSSSGEPQTHPSLAGDGATSAQKVEIELVDDFICADAVDVVKLLRASRAKLFARATLWNANVLVNERYVKTFGYQPLPVLFF